MNETISTLRTLAFNFLDGLRCGMFSKSLWGPGVSVCFAIALTVTPIPDHWRIPVVFAAWGVFALAGIGWIIAHVWEPKSPSEGFSLPTSAASEQLTDIDKRLDHLVEAVTRNPSVEADVKLSLLREQHDRLARKREELTSEQKETLEDQEVTLQSLEDGRKRHLADKELQRQQQQLAARQREITSLEATKKLEREIEPIETDFAKKYAPVIEHALTALYRMLLTIAEQSSQTISTDFPAVGQPSIYASNLLKDGKFVNAKHTIRVGSNKEWEFSFVVGGALNAAGNPTKPIKRLLGLRIESGLASVNISSRGEPELQLVFWVYPPGHLTRHATRNEPQKHEKCALSDHKKPIEEFLKALIQYRYNHSSINTETPKQP
jgi:hypothetical protein